MRERAGARVPSPAVLVVQKFGGTSVADPDRIREVASQVARTRKRGEQVVVVVSAMGKETDELIRLAGVATLLVFSEWGRLGYLPQYGVDGYLIARAKKERRGGLLDHLVEAQAAGVTLDGRPITDRDILASLWGMYSAGTDTTGNSFASFFVIFTRLK